MNANKEALKGLASLRDEQNVIVHLKNNKILLEGIAHCRAWFFDRHFAAIKSGRAEMEETVHEEAAGFFLLDAAADAARAHYFQCQNIKEAATVGVRMLGQGLSAQGDPIGIRTSMATRIELWIGLVKQAVAASSKSKLRASTACIVGT